MKSMRLLILGGSGAGKSTQAHLLCKHLQIPLISVGEILREAIAQGSELGQQAQTYVEKGELIPDQIMIEFIRQRLLQADVSIGWLLEGYPRTSFQAEELDFLLDSLQQQLSWAIYLKVPDSVMVSRSLARSLTDDQPEIIERRLQLFQERTIPILEYYGWRDRLLTINGDQPQESVQQEIQGYLAINTGTK
jgi:adenylate kinase